ncbi:MAG: hybrid sensor histidine kinase/response regulator [Massilia sp.]|nr:hybrid sensor histidine kinase/response regulator [Massilia sp.]
MSDFPVLEEKETALNFEASVYHALFESSSDCVKILSVDGEIKSIDACSRALLAVNDLATLEGTMWSSLWDTQSHTEMERALAAARAGKTGKFGGLRSVGEAKARWWDAWVRPIIDGSGRVQALVAVSRDMTSAREADVLSRQASAALAVAAEANAKLRAFFEQGANFAALTRSDGAVLEVNQAAVALAGFEMNDIIGRKFWDCGWWNRSAEVSEIVKAGLALAASGNRFREELCYFMADGSERIVDLTLAPVLGDDGTVLFVAVTGTDITDRKLAAEKLRQISADFSEADRRKTEFLVTLAHELRNPLAPISNGLDVMRLCADKPEVVARTRAMMARQVGQLSHLVDDLLDIARISSGKVDLKKLEVDLAAILAVAVETSAPLMDASGHTFTLAIAPEPMHLFADPTRIIQAVSNLLNNAAKYTPRGGAISLSAAREGDEAVISIADNGVGIAESQIESVFTMFSQVGKSIERSQGGLGIGLSLVRQLVGLHGGTVLARSAGLDAGSVFTIRLPLAISDQDLLSAPGIVGEPLDAASLNILIADDNADAADSMSDVMAMLGHECSVAYDGAQALAVAKASRPDAIFLDIGMPFLNGYETALAIRKTDGIEGTVLIALTGWGGADERAKSSLAGFDHHITKPANLDTLTTLLASIAAKKRAGNGNALVQPGQ